MDARASQEETVNKLGDTKQEFYTELHLCDQGAEEDTTLQIVCTK